MVTLLEPPADHKVRWAELRAAFEWVEALHGCPQDAVWHAEGDVGVHTEMVMQALVELPAFQSLSPPDRWAVWLGALLHDVAKPLVTREEDGRITSRGHSRAGARLARRLLWELGVPFEVRETACAIVARHQVPFFLIDQDDPRGRLARLSQVVRCDLLALVAEADARGREAVDKQRLIDNIDLFRALADELGCTSSPWPFVSDHARFLCGQQLTRSIDAPALPEPTFTVTVLSGLPASGKDTWVAEHGGGRPTVSLDQLRVQLGIAPTDNQGRIVQAAKEAARVNLRAQRGFVWNATNLARSRRLPIISLCADYGARVEVVYVETTPESLERRQRGRKEPVPRRVIERMLRQWEVPHRLEAHRVHYVVA